MNLNPIEKLFKKASTVGLDEKKKDIIRQEILLFMKKNPLEKESMKKRLFGFYVADFNNVRLKTPAVVLAGMLLFLLVGGGITSAKASSALPGDLLYPVKLGFNEKIKEVLAFSDEAKLSVYIKLAQVRLQEFGELSVQGRINSDNETQINSNFKNHSDKVLEYIGKLNTTNNSKEVEITAINFEASLRAQSIIIDGLQKNTTDKPTNYIISSIEDATSKISDFSADLNNRKDVNIKPSDRDRNIQEKISTIQDSVKIVKKLIQKNKVNIGSEAVSQSEDNLNLVQQKIDEGKNKLSKNQDDYKGLNSSLQEASVITQESKYLIDAKNNLKVNIPININSKNRSIDKKNNGIKDGL